MCNCFTVQGWYGGSSVIYVTIGWSSSNAGLYIRTEQEALPRLMMALRDRFWPCENVFGLAEIVFALARSFMALRDGFWSCRDRFLQFQKSLIQNTISKLIRTQFARYEQRTSAILRLVYGVGQPDLRRLSVCPHRDMPCRRDHFSTNTSSRNF